MGKIFSSILKKPVNFFPNEVEVYERYGFLLKLRFLAGAIWSVFKTGRDGMDVETECTL